MTTNDTLTRVTDTIISLLEAGTAPWRRPWATRIAGAPAPGLDLPVNAATGKAYRGINVLVLWAAAQQRGYTGGGWLTFRQAQALGARVRKGSTGVPVVFWRMLQTDTDTEDPRTIPLLRHYTVFHTSQVDGLPDQTPAPAPTIVEAPAGLPAAEALTARYTDAPPVTHGGPVACYHPGRDHISMPARETFEAPAAYYLTLWHELAHSTGHQSRLDRRELRDIARFGDSAYSTEELTAELTSAFMASLAGLDTPEALAQSAAYCKGWLTALRAEPRMLLTAAGRAQRALDYMTQTAPAPETAEA